MTLIRAEARMIDSASSRWWLWLVAGIAWVIASLIMLQFNTTSATTIGIIAGVMFLVGGIQYLVLAAFVEGWKWVWALFGVILIAGGITALVYPERTFLVLANLLGFMLALTGIFWMIEAFVLRDFDDLWWLTLVAGILMILLGFWLGGQLIGVQAATLLVFVGLWAMFRGILNIVTAFQLKAVHDRLGDVYEAVDARSST